MKRESPFDLISLGEMMLRLSPPKFERLRRATSLELHACGAQFNIAANLASLGKKTRFITKLPQNDLGQLALSLGNSYGVDMSQVWFEGTKIGMVFVEFSAAPRQLTHLYDRAGSAASTITPDDFYWPGLVSGARLAYLDGIFPALNPGCQRAALAYARAAKESGCTLCFDVNYRESLWTPDKARKFYQQILPQIDILVTNRAVSERVFDFEGIDDELLSAYWDKFGCAIVCLTYREIDGLQRGSWRSIGLQGDKVHTGRLFEFEVVDQFGSGDAFFAGLLYGLLEKGDLQYGLDFGDALCALAHTLEGDVATVSPQEVDALLEEGYSLVTQR